MGIDIYARWKGQTEAELSRQRSGGFSLVDGHVGYLREAYHGEPYATAYLCREAFESPTSSAEIPAAVLRARLPETLRLSEARQRNLYAVSKPEDIEPFQQSFRDFVALCESKEHETGEPVLIVASY